MVWGNIAGGAGIGGHGKGSEIGLLAGDLLDMLIELFEDMSKWCWVKG
jgi:hypothetical protein